MPFFLPPNLFQMAGLGKRSAGAADIGTSREPAKRQKSWADTVSARALENGIETDEHRISQREKQISYGKNTLAYDTLVQNVPRHRRTRQHPCTPESKQKCSKRSFDGQVKKWRRMLHAFKEEHDRVGRRREAGACDRKALVEVGRPGVEKSGLVGKNVQEAEGAVDAPAHKPEDSREDELSDWEEEDFLDDIQLDDEGNPIFVSPAPTATGLGSSTDTDADKSQDGEPVLPVVKTIFDKF